MNRLMLAMCATVATGVLGAMYLTLWSTRTKAARLPTYRQHIVSELVWATIPFLLLIAAAFPAAMALLSNASEGR
jgi:heme/copper-type cytochrome/quinol oxidase subunit 2